MSIEQNRPFLTIITVCKNSVSTINAALQSVAEQLHVDGLVEHIVVDGASVDGTLDVVAQYPHIRCISEPDGGISEAFNKGIGLARGEVIGFLHADDRLFSPDSLIKVITAFKVHPDVEAVVGKLALDGVVQEFPPSQWQRFFFCFLERLRVNEASLLGGYMPHPATYVRRDVYERLGLYKGEFRIAMDYEFILRMRKARIKTYFLNDVVYAMSSGGVSTSRVYQAAFEAYKAARINDVPVIVCGPRLIYTVFVRWLLSWKKKG